MKIKESRQCPICQHIDNLEHFFYYCESTKLFWVQVETWLKEKLLLNFDFTVLEILLGAINIDKRLFHTINYIILQEKRKMKSLTLSVHMSSSSILSSCFPDFFRPLSLTKIYWKPSLDLYIFLVFQTIRMQLIS